jgi:prepilin-type N-terminal cleavage/methylation domain-containing protein
MLRLLRPSPSARQGGFTLVELLISLVLLVLALTLAAQLLLEASKLFAETSGEALDTPVPLAIARIRGDIQGATRVVPMLDKEGVLVQVAIQGYDGQIFYSKEGDTLYRTFVPRDEMPQDPAPLWRGVKTWSCARLPGTRLIDLEVLYTRRSTARTPLPTLPVDRGPLEETLTQRMFLLYRGGGMGGTW